MVLQDDEDEGAKQSNTSEEAEPSEEDTSGSGDDSAGEDKSLNRRRSQPTRGVRVRLKGAAQQRQHAPAAAAAGGAQALPKLRLKLSEREAAAASREPAAAGCSGGALPPKLGLKVRLSGAAAAARQAAERPPQLERQNTSLKLRLKFGDVGGGIPQVDGAGDDEASEPEEATADVAPDQDAGKADAACQAGDAPVAAAEEPGLAATPAQQLEQQQQPQELHPAACPASHPACSSPAVQQQPVLAGSAVYAELPIGTALQTPQVQPANAADGEADSMPQVHAAAPSAASSEQAPAPPQPAVGQAQRTEAPTPGRH